MGPLAEFLKKFENLQNPKAIRQKLARIILEQTKVEVGEDNITPKPRSFYINLPPTAKSHIFSKKKLIEKSFGFPIS